MYQRKNLLPKIISEGEAPTRKLSKIKLRFPRRFTKLVIISFILSPLFGYYPNFGVPPVKKSFVKAVALEQSGEVIANSFSKPLILPHPGYLSTRFSSYHPAIDIAIGLGMPIHPIIDGEILETDRDLFGLGNYVVITHEKGYQSKYAHMGRIYVKKGDKVTSSNILGEVGLTGHTSGPHTHLEVTLNGKFIDPQTLLPELPNLPVITASSSTKSNSASATLK